MRLTFLSEVLFYLLDRHFVSPNLYKDCSVYMYMI